MAEMKPKTWKYEHGEVRLADLPIAAGLLALDGAALDGSGRWYYCGHTGAERRAFDELTRKPGVRLLRVQLVGSHVERIEKRLLSDWVDKSPEGKGRHYSAGEYAPMPQVMFHLRCCYETLNTGAKVRQAWSEDDAREWLLRWHRPGQFIIDGSVFTDQTNKLRNHIRDNYTGGAKQRMPGVNERG